MLREIAIITITQANIPMAHIPSASLPLKFPNSGRYHSGPFFCSPHTGRDIRSDDCGGRGDHLVAAPGRARTSRRVVKSHAGAYGKILLTIY